MRAHHHPFHGDALRFHRPVEPSISERAAELVEAIEREWSLSASLGPSDDEADFEAAYERRSRLLDMAEALPCTCREARHAKALALCWIAFSDLWKRDKGREDYGTDGRLALDINASMAAGSARDILALA